MRMVILGLSLIISTSAWAADDARKIDFTQVLINKDKKPFVECVKVDTVDRNKCIEEIEITLGWITATALDIPKPNLSGADKVKRGGLAYRVVDGKAVELTVKEITTILEALDDLNYKNTAIYIAKSLLDPASVK